MVFSLLRETVTISSVPLPVLHSLLPFVWTEDGQALLFSDGLLLSTVSILLSLYFQVLLPLEPVCQGFHFEFHVESEVTLQRTGQCACLGWASPSVCLLCSSGDSEEQVGVGTGIPGCLECRFWSTSWRCGWWGASCWSVQTIWQSWFLPRPPLTQQHAPRVWCSQMREEICRRFQTDTGHLLSWFLYVFTYKPSDCCFVSVRHQSQKSNRPELLSASRDCMSSQQATLSCTSHKVWRVKLMGAHSGTHTLRTTDRPSLLDLPGSFFLPLEGSWLPSVHLAVVSSGPVTSLYSALPLRNHFSFYRSAYRNASFNAS